MTVGLPLSTKFVPLHSSRLIHVYLVVDLKPHFKATQQVRDGEKLLKGRGEEYPTYTITFYFLALLVHCFVILIRGIQLLVQYLKLLGKKKSRKVFTNRVSYAV